MQTNQTAAAASRTPAAAAIQAFSEYCVSIGNIRGNFTDADRIRISNLDAAIMSHFADLTGVRTGIDNIVRAAGFPTFNAGTRVLRKAAAAHLTGVADFWVYAKTAAKIDGVRNSIDNGYLTADDFKERDFFSVVRNCSGGYPNFSSFVCDYYANDAYRLAVSGAGDERAYRKSDTFFCPLLGKFAADSTRTRVFTCDKDLADAGAIYGNSLFMPKYTTAGADCWQVYCSDWAISTQKDGAFISYYRAYIFEEDFAAFQVAEIVENGDRVHISEGYIWQSDGLLHQFEEGRVCSPADACNSYHAGNRLANLPVRFSRNAPYLVGFEVEKEDTRVKCSITARDFQRELPNFRKERDGSLDCDAGFEFITPPLELSPRNIRAYLEARPVAVAHINAAFSTACGGHIHISRRGYSGPDLFRMIAGHLPLLHALFPARADGSNSRYCQAKSASDLLRDREKYQSINILPDRIEIRIFGAVRGLENLVWRAGLVLKLFKHAASTPDAGFEKLPRLFPHLKKVYTTPEEIERLVKRVEKYARKFENFRPDAGCDAAGNVTDAARFKTYRPASARLSSYKSVLSNF